MQTNLEGKVAIVTGGARGIGRSYAEALAGEGAAVLIADLLVEEGEQTAKAIEADGGRAMFQRVDVTDPASTESMAATAAEEFGGVDILVNNAAMFATLTGGLFSDIDPERWDRTMAVNVKGPFLCIKAVVPHMRARGGGAIVNQSSIAACGMMGMLDYGTSKTALIGLTKNVSLELGRDAIRVNAIAPGGVATEAHAQITGDADFSALAARSKAVQAIPDFIHPEDLVGTMLYLVSDASRFMTGQTVVVDGGRFFLG
jgi:3-oxoacyl-[acyl-carrier protein] reductase